MPAEQPNLNKTETPQNVRVYDAAAISFPAGALLFPGDLSIRYEQEEPEDRVFVNNRGLSLGIFDGGSAQQPAAFAAETARCTFESILPAGFPPASVDVARGTLVAAATQTQHAFQDAVEKSVLLERMGTTALVGQVVVDETGKPTDIVVGNAGRSRMYLVGSDGAVSRITHDHNYYEELRRSAEDRVPHVTFEEDLRDLPVESQETQREPIDVDVAWVTNYFDKEGCTFEITTHSLDGVVAVFATSDAVHDWYRDEEEIAETIWDATDAESIATRLIQRTQGETDRVPFAIDDKSVVVLVLDSQAFQKAA